MNVHTYRRRHLDPGLIAEVRARHGLSQREFAEVLGIDIDTLQNWEQGRNKPDAAALNLVMAFDRSPELIEQAAFEPVA
ncbi:MAG TPA: type II toxin-antitoxin system MqsA family antitoxin [Acetobacteraceae bacterium]